MGKHDKKKRRGLDLGVAGDSHANPSKRKKRKRCQEHQSQPPSLNGSDVPVGESKGKNLKRAQSKSSLAQLLKKQRGVAAKTAPPPIWKDRGGRQRAFLTPLEDQGAFNDCLKTSFSGFHYESPESLPSSLHQNFDSSFDGMDRGGLFMYDVIQPGKKRLTRTSVTRTLVGDPGSTYKYLGLRLFSHPWVDVDDDGDAIDNFKANDVRNLQSLGYSAKTASALKVMGTTNANLVERSKTMLRKHVKPHVTPVGSADFNLTLVNKMEPSTTKRDLKREAAYGMGKISVGWHRDSGLKDFSTIAVYQTLRGSSSRKSDNSWGVALRAMDGGAGGPLPSVPPLMVPLPSGSLYYMLDSFNHNHEHAVIAGSGGIRYSSTHRVAREGQGTWQYIRDKVRAFDLGKGIVTSKHCPLRQKKEKLVSHVRAQQNLMTEIEFEWLRQWFVQGQKHASLHPYWHRPIKSLQGSFCDLEKASCQIIATMERLSTETDRGESHVSIELFDVAIEALSERLKLRRSWKERYRDPIFDNIPADERPLSCPCLDREDDLKDHMPERLDLLVSKLRQWRSLFEGKTENEKVHTEKKVKKGKSGALTKKESKRRASNWERLKTNLKR
ncbi:hypothetical protein ACHAWF_017035 [Thalassiosira exigua]